MIKFNIMPMLRAKGRTRYWLAKETGMSYPNIAKLVDGKTLAVRLETIEALCQVLECTPNDLFLIDYDKPEGSPSGKCPRRGWLRRGFFVFPFSKGRGLADLSGLGDAPPILSFSGPRKRENAPCTVEERKRGWCQTACGCLAHSGG